MHICIPDTREMRNPTRGAYLLYNVHIDGLYHCSLRYKQLLHLHQALSRKFNGPHHHIPQFPPKKLLPLTANQTEERRQQLEKYLQSISQDKTVSNSSIFNLFLLEAQRESARFEEKHVHLDVELVNGQKIRIPLVTHDSADSVLTAVCRALGLNDRYHAYFCLCLCGYDVVRDKLIIKRKLSFFEAPFITLQMAIQQQEQLQSVLYAASSSSTVSINHVGNMNNNSDLNCNCLNCSQQQEVQQQRYSTATDTTGVPYISSSNVINNTNLTNLYSGHSRASRNGEDVYLRTTNNNNSHTPPTTSTNGHSTQHWPNNTGRSFVTHRILLRKSYWDPHYDSYIMNDQQALNLLFIQTVYDMKHSLMFVDRDTYQQLETFLANDSKLEFILLVRNIKYYNYVHFEPCYSDYPRPRTKVMISIGSKELNMRVLKTPSKSAQAMQTNYNRTTTILPTLAAAQTIGSPTTTTTAPIINEVKPETTALYCTSSLVSGGFRDMTTMDDLVEEEYSFKVPLIRCWRLTSLEMLNSSNDSQNQNRQSTTKIAGGKRKSFSLFNSVLGNSNNSLNDHHNSSSTSTLPSDNCTDPSVVRPYNIIGSGTSGHSLMASLISTSERNSNNNGNYSSSNPSNGHSFSRFNGNHDDHHVDCRSKFCQHESHFRQALHNDDINQTQFSQYELSFEYLVSKDKLKWITISSDQAIFISISLQGVVDELVSKRDCLMAGNDPYIQPTLVNIEDTGTLTAQTQSTKSSCSIASANASTAPISIMPSRSGSYSDYRSKLSESFTYLYRDGGQKLLKSHSIDRFCANLASSPNQLPSCSSSSSRRGHGVITTSGGSYLPQSAPTNSRHSTVMQAGFWNLDARNLATSPSRYLFGFGQASSNNHSTFEIANIKKAPSPIINDAFEGATNEDDL